VLQKAEMTEEIPDSRQLIERRDRIARKELSNSPTLNEDNMELKRMTAIVPGSGRGSGRAMPARRQR
jgi:hypothetical protein